jgi:hypothetical protein
MTELKNALFGAGVVFPSLSLITAIGCFLYQLRYKKHSSPVFIPFIGPILLTCWVVLDDKSILLIPFVWIADIGTLAFLAVSPQLIREWWRVSAFTRILTLHGSKDIQSAVITLHSTGHYHLEKTWKRPVGVFGIVGLGEPGVFTHGQNQYELTSHCGLRRILRQTDEGVFSVDEVQPQGAEMQKYSLDGWMLKE